MLRAISIVFAPLIFILLLTWSPAFARECEPTACADCPDPDAEQRCFAQKYIFSFKCQQANPRQKRACEQKKKELLEGLKQLKRM
jgi:hypothetical protein